MNIFNIQALTIPLVILVGCGGGGGSNSTQTNSCILLPKHTNVQVEVEEKIFEKGKDVTISRYNKQVMVSTDSIEVIEIHSLDDLNPYAKTQTIDFNISNYKKHITRVVNSTVRSSGDLIEEEHQVLTFSPSKIEEAKRICKNQSWVSKFLTEEKTDINGTEKIIPSLSKNQTHFIESIDTKKIVKAGKFTTYLKKTTEAGRILKQWYDVKTGLIVYMEYRNELGVLMRVKEIIKIKI